MTRSCRHLSHAIDAERTLLGALLLNGDRIIDVAPLLTAADFYEPLHRDIFAGMERLHELRAAIDPVTVTDALRSHAGLTAVRGLLYLTTLAQNVPSASNAVHYADILREKAMRRLATLGSTMTALATRRRDDRGRSVRTG